MKPKLRTAGCFVDVGDRFLLLHRSPNKLLGNTWGLPAGKVEHGESDLETIVRETFEETGIRARSEDFTLLCVYEFDFSYLLLTFPTFSVQLDALPEVTLSPADHQAYTWVTAEGCYHMGNLIDGLQDLLTMTGRL